MAATRRKKSDSEDTPQASNVFNFAELKEKASQGKRAGRLKLLSEDILSKPTDWVSSRSPLIDMTLGAPGFACGRIHSIYGESSVGKTTLVYDVLAETQIRGGIAVLIDAEFALDPDRAQAIGIDTDRLLVYEPDSLEDCFEFILEITEDAKVLGRKPGQLMTIGFDSIAGIGVAKEMEGDQTMGGHARVVSANLRRITATIANQKVCLLLVNQYREKIGGMGFGPQKTMLAERPMFFYSSTRTEVSRVMKVKREVKGKQRIVGIRSKFINQKNKLAAPYMEAEGLISFSNPEGIDRVNQYFLAAVEAGLIVKTGSRWKLLGAEKSFYETDFPRVLRTNPQIVQDVIAYTGFSYPLNSGVWNPFPANDEGFDDVEEQEAA